MENLSEQQQNLLWGRTGPYSEVNFIIQTQIYGDHISQIAILVNAEINPLSYKMVKQNRIEFLDDPQILQFINQARDRGPDLGAVIALFEEEYTDQHVIVDAQRRRQYATEAIIRLHKFAMFLLSLRPERD